MIGTLLTARTIWMSLPPSRSGSPRSKTTRSGAVSTTAWRPAIAVGADATACPRSESERVSEVRIAASSSISSRRGTSLTVLNAGADTAPAGPRFGRHLESALTPDRRRSTENGHVSRAADPSSAPVVAPTGRRRRWCGRRRWLAAARSTAHFGAGLAALLRPHHGRDTDGRRAGRARSQRQPGSDHHTDRSSRKQVAAQSAVGGLREFCIAPTATRFCPGRCRTNDQPTVPVVPT